MIQTIDSQFVKKIIPSRIKGHYYKKYSFGLMLVIGGSDFYSGSPALNALAAFRSGVDMVRIFAPERAANIISSFSPILAAFPVKGSYLTKKDLSFLLSQIEIAKEVSEGRCALVIGGGLGRTEETQEVVLELLKKIDIPVVIDADAIYAISQD
ncbi:MAG: ADP-dependent NAD(P)H-hydrate dehydratase, partial [Minisyncoccales bacterium]